jgi:DNA modification methylase
VTVEVRLGDCRALLRELADDSVDAVVTDPPYHLTANKGGGSGDKSVNLVGTFKKRKFVMFLDVNPRRPDEVERHPDLFAA